MVFGRTTIARHTFKSIMAYQLTMKRRTFVSTTVSALTAVSLAGCTNSGGAKKNVEVVNAELQRKNEGKTNETVRLVGKVKNVSDDPIDVTVTVTFYKKSQKANNYSETLEGVNAGETASFNIEAGAIGRTASQIDGYVLELESNGYTYTTQVTASG